MKTKQPLHRLGFSSSSSRSTRRMIGGVGAALLAIVFMVLGATCLPDHNCGRQIEDPKDTRVVPTSRIEALASDSPFRAPIPENAQIDPLSDLMIARASRDGRLYANMVEFGIPIYYANASTPRYTVPCSVTKWGPCPFDGVEIPIPDQARPHTGSDGAMVVIDQDAGLVYEFWQARHDGANWLTGFGAINDLWGSGWGGASTGSGASRLAGVIRIDEIRAGEIDHALVMQSDNVCAGAFRAPAIKTDGTSHRPDCIPEGARIRLDPTLDLDALDLSPGVYAVAKAMQTYGGFVIDRGGTSLGVSFELDPNAVAGSPGETYRDAGLRWDYYGMDEVPWDRLQVMR